VRKEGGDDRCERTFYVSRRVRDVQRDQEMGGRVKDGKKVREK
jgi:hypothetical protein